MSILKLKGNDSGTGTVTLEAPNTNTDQTIDIPDGAGSFVTANASGDVAVTGDLTVDTSTLYVDSANNNVGIGTSSPDRFTISGGGSVSDGTTLTIDSGSNTNKMPKLELAAYNVSNGNDIGQIIFGHFGGDATADGYGVIAAERESGGGDGAIALTFGTGTSGTERARIDSSGNLLVGTTSYSPDNAGFGVRGSDGLTYATRSDGASFIFNRTTSNGTITEYRKDGSTVGDIGTRAGNLNIGKGDIGLEFHAGDNTIYPCQGGSSYALTNGFSSLGGGSYRFNTLYASNGSINTSDENQKQQIASLTSDEITAATAISKLFKTYKWNDAVDLKGDAARTHTGVIAQQVEQAMTDAGLDASKYAFWCSDTVYEVFTEVPAIEAVDEVTDETGNIITQAVEAQEAYTKIEHYNTAEEAPENAIKRTTKGVRYAELLAFIGAATEQRLASIEARLDALEAV